MKDKLISRSDLAAWDAIANEYSIWLTAGVGNSGRAFQDLIARNLWPVLGNVENQKILDMGCGEGYWSRQLAKKRGRVVAVDGSANMIATAQAQNSEEEIDFVIGDILDPLPLVDAWFDIVLCNMVLMDLCDIDGIFREIRRVLKVNGRLAFSVVHPCFYEAIGDWIETDSLTPAFRHKARYREQIKYLKRLEGLPAGPLLSHYNRPIESYVNALLRNGFSVTHFSEPGFTMEDIEREILPASFYRYVVTANYLMMGAVKTVD